MIGVVGVLALASGSRYYFVMTLGERVVADLRGDLFAHLTRLDASFFDSEKTGEIVSRLSSDTTQLKATFGSSASIALRNFFMFIGAVTMMVVTSPKLSAYVLVAIPVIILPLYAAGRAVRERSRAAQDTLAVATAFAAESLSAIRVMQAFVAEAASAARFRAAAMGAYEAARSTTVSRAIVTTAAIFLAFASVVVVLWLGAQDVLAGRMTGGQLSQFVLFAVLAAGALGELVAGVERGFGGRRSRRAHRRTAGRPAEDHRARQPAASAGARARRDRVRFASPSPIRQGRRRSS